MGSAAFPIDESQIVGLFTESVLYGIYLMTFLSCMRLLLFRDGSLQSFSSLNHTMVAAALAMFLFGTLDVAFGLRHNLDAFIYSQGYGTPIAQFSSISYWVNVMKMVSYVGQTFVGDSILLFRCWVVYNKRLLIIFTPLVLWLGGIACGITACYFEATTNSNSLNSPALVPFISSMLSLTLAMNLLTTVLIVRRIWSIRTGGKLEQDTQRPLSRLTRVLIESGTLYTFSIIILFILYMTSNNAQFIVSDAVVQIIGITFNLVLTRVAGHCSEPEFPTSASFEFARPLAHSDSTISAV